MTISNYSNGSTTIGTSPTLVCTVDEVSTGVLVQNTGSAAIYFGGANVTTSGAYTGISVAANATLFIPSVGGLQHSLYATVASSTQPCTWLYAQAS